MDLDLAKEIISDAGDDFETMHRRVDQAIKDRLREFDPRFVDDLEDWMDETNRARWMWYA